MLKIKILIEGYVKEIDGHEFASSTTTLIIDNNINIIIDPGMDRKLLLKALVENNLTTSDINYVILTHSHPDHTLLAGIFKNAKIINDSEIYHWDGKIEEYNSKILNTNIEIIKTPGHDTADYSVLVNTKKFGKVAIVGDVFWWSDTERQKTNIQSLLDHKDPYVSNQNELIKSRKLILKIADYIIPGHGKMFEVKK